MSRLLLTTLLVALAAPACYSERLPPPTFRHQCSANGDCGDGESCVSGLCQVECTQATATDDCGLMGQGASYLACINGVCSTACDLSADPCPGPQSCLEIPGISEALGSGVCMEECSAGSCPEGELCLQGFCAPTCDPNDEGSCDDDQTCLAGVCVPDEVAATDTTLTGNPTDTDTDTGTDAGTVGPGATE